MGEKSHYLLNIEELPKTNHSAIAIFFNNSLSLLKYHRIKIVCTDAAKYMIKSMEGLRVLYSQMIHITCLAHGLNKVAEAIRAEYDIVNQLISTTKKVFLKAPKRIQIFKAMAPQLPLPRNPVVTRWGTWLEAANYYADNFQKIREIINTLNEDDAQCIGENEINA